ncbi:MAG: hypothetical protein IJ869_01070 [Clostridiales bacterium]|nr:hypothetical protein [Clostridiales bacterium]
MNVSVDLSYAFRSVLFVFNISNVYMSVFGGLTAVRATGRRRDAILPLITYIVTFFLIQTLYCISLIRGRENPAISSFWEKMTRMPPAVLVGLTFACTIFLVIYSIDIMRYRKMHVGLKSYKEAIDALDTGLCYYWDSGMIKLINPKMENLSKELLGRRVIDAVNLFNAAADRGNILRTHDGRVYAFSRRKLIVGGYRINEMTAYDVTEEDHLAEQLKKKEKELTDFNERLRIFGESVDEVTLKREVLNAKIKIHDDMGHALIRTKHFIEEGKGNASEEREIRKFWLVLAKGGVRQGTDLNENESLLEDIREAASAIGLNIVMTGELPQNRDQVKVLVHGLRECLTNAYKYAEADNIFVKINAREDLTFFELSNDGKAPEGKIKEGGGLSGLRKEVEQRGGKMAVVSDPAFAIRIILPERRKTR